jgi:hypothetical protein
MIKQQVIAFGLLAGFVAPAAAADFDAEPLHSKLVDAFDNRQSEDVKSLPCRGQRLPSRQRW